MVRAPGQLDLEGFSFLVDKAFRLQIDPGAVDMDPAVGALKGSPVSFDAAVTLLPFVGLGPGITSRSVLIAAIRHANKFHRDVVGEFHVHIPDRRRVAGTFAEISRIL